MIALAIAAWLAGSAVAAPSAPAWDCLRFLVGDWVGENGGGAPGQADVGSCSFEPKMGGQVLLRTGHAEYPAQNGQPAHVHDDLMVIEKEPGSSALKATFVDNEGHVIHYSVTCDPAGKGATFLSDAVSGQPRFRLSYKGRADGKIDGTFETAAPGGPFNPYLHWTLKAKS